MAARKRWIRAMKYPRVWLSMIPWMWRKRMKRRTKSEETKDDQLSVFDASSLLPLHSSCQPAHELRSSQLTSATASPTVISLSSVLPSC